MPKLGAITLTLLALLAGSPAAAQDYPTKPIRVVIPYPPGGSNDVVGRMISQQLGERLGKQIVVDNRAGAGGTIGTEHVARSAPDGYTLVLLSISHAVNPWLYKLTYDPVKSFAPVAMFATGPNVLAVNPGLPINSVQDLLNEAKKKPGQLMYATAGVGSFQHLGAELFRITAKIDTVHVPFRGGSPAMIDVMGGHTHYLLGSLIQTTPHIRSGKLRAIGTGGKTRASILPDVPTIAEAGVPGYEATNWWGLYAPAGTPQPIIDKLHQEITAVLSTEATQRQFEAEGATVAQMSPTEFGAFMETEIAKWGRVVKEANIKAE